MECGVSAYVMTLPSTSAHDVFVCQEQNANDADNAGSEHEEEEAKNLSSVEYCGLAIDVACCCCNRTDWMDALS